MGDLAKPRQPKSKLSESTEAPVATSSRQSVLGWHGRAAAGLAPFSPPPLSAISHLLDHARARSESVDLLRFRQALGNPVDNALRYGTGDIQLRARQKHEAVEIEVRDEGPSESPHSSEGGPSSGST
jgi:signal transduction histidine kinase